VVSFDCADKMMKGKQQLVNSLITQIKSSFPEVFDKKKWLCGCGSMQQ
jgi:hypothetical protein